MKKKDGTLLTLGTIFIAYWLLDFFNNALLKHDYSWLLWYSAAGFLLTGIALVIQNNKLIYSLFCALFIVESIWIIDLFYVIASHKSLIGFAEYILSPGFHTKDLYFTLYHSLIPIGLLIAVLRIKKPYKYAWIGATIFASTLAVLTYFLTNPSTSQVNCLHSINQCHTVFSFLYKINNPYRIFVALTGLTVFVYIPTDYALFFFKKNK